MMNLQSILLLLSATSVVQGLTPSEPSLNRRGFVQTASAAVISTGLVNTILPLDPALAKAADLPDTGKKAPSFELPNSRGNGLTTLNSLVDSKKWTVLYFYPGAFTSGCTLE